MSMPDPEHQDTCKAEHGLWGVTCDRPTGHIAAGWLHHHATAVVYRPAAIEWRTTFDSDSEELIVPPQSHEVDITWSGPEGIMDHQAWSLRVPGQTVEETP